MRREDKTRDTVSGTGNAQPPDWKTSQVPVARWTSNGTANGTVRVKDALPTNGYETMLAAPRGSIVFRAGAASGGTALWTSDGTAAGTKELVRLPAKRRRSWTSRPSRLLDPIELG